MNRNWIPTPRRNMTGDQQADELVDVQVGPQHIAEIGAEYHHDALGDVDDVEHAEDQRQPDRHQAVDPAFEHSVGYRAEKGTHVSALLRSLLSVPIQELLPPVSPPRRA
jgi:hypothetical protein